MVSMVLVLWEVAAIQRNRCRTQGQNHVAWLQWSEIPEGFYYRNLILGIYGFSSIMPNVSQWVLAKYYTLRLKRKT